MEQDVLSWISRQSLPLEDLTPGLLASCLRSITTSLDGKTKLSAPTLQKRRQALNATLEFGVSKKFIFANPLKEVKVKLDLSDETLNANVILTPSQCRTIQTRTASTGDRGPLFAAFFACMWLAGLRPSEVVALRPKDILLSNNEGESEIVVSRAIVEVGKLWTQEGTARVTKQPKARKKGHSRRVPIPEELVAVLRPLIQGIPDDALVFAGPRSEDRSQPISLSAIERKWMEVRETDHRLYDLRHTNATLLIYAGLNVSQVAACLGHSVAVCSRVYLGVFNDQQKSSISKVNRFLTESQNQLLA